MYQFYNYSVVLSKKFEAPAGSNITILGLRERIIKAARILIKG